MQRIAVDGRVLQTLPHTGVSNYLDAIARSWSTLPSRYPVTFYFNQRSSWEPPSYITEAFSSKCSSYSNKLLAFSWKLFLKPDLSSYVSEDTVWMPNINFIPKLSGKRLVVSIHDLSFIHFPEFFSKKMRLWHSLLDVKRVVASAETIICDSEATKRDVMNYYNLAAEKVVVIPLGVDPIYFKRLEAPKGVIELPEKFIASIGSIEPRKNIVTAIAAFEILAKRDKDLHFVIAGPLGWLSKPFLKALHTSPHKDRIWYTGYVTTDQKRRILQRAQAFVFPSFYEGFGLPVLEAFASECPVIAGCTGSLPEVVGDAGMLIHPYQTNELAEAIEMLLADGALREQYIKKGCVRAKQYTWDSTAKETYAVLSGEAVCG